MFAAQASNLWVAVLLVGLAAAAHQGWSANLFTLTSDMFPRRAVGSVVGIGGMAGAVGGMFNSLVVGEILTAHRQLCAGLLPGRVRLPDRLAIVAVTARAELEPATVDCGAGCRVQGAEVKR